MVEMQPIDKQMVNTYTNIHIKLSDINRLRTWVLDDKGNISIVMDGSSLFFESKEDVETFIENIKTSLNIN